MRYLKMIEWMMNKMYVRHNEFVISFERVKIYIYIYRRKISCHGWNNSLCTTRDILYIIFHKEDFLS